MIYLCILFAAAFKMFFANRDIYCSGECRWVEEKNTKTEYLNISQCLGQLDGVKTKCVILRKYPPLLIIQDKLVYNNLTNSFPNLKKKKNH